MERLRLQPRKVSSGRLRLHKIAFYNKKNVLLDRLRCVELPAGGGIASIHVAGPGAAGRALLIPIIPYVFLIANG